MHFLKCNNCGHFNEVKTQYMVFCIQCNKKLENNFSEWSKRNAEKSFDDYKNQVCTTELNLGPIVQPKSLKKIGLKFWIIIAVVLIAFISIVSFGGHRIIGLIKKPLYEKVLMKTAEEINKTCPVMIDNITRLDNAIAMPDNVFQYNYTIISMLKDEININEVKSYLEPGIVNFVKTNPQMKTIRDYKTTVNYYYKDKSGVYLFTICVTPEQYE
ncbi:MAG: hypothetical protein HXX18_10895 [Bacteroidetes bacterium]|nr:hypothetical protein [Bacteroidota bacterium]